MSTPFDDTLSSISSKKLAIGTNTETAIIDKSQSKVPLPLSPTSNNCGNRVLYLSSSTTTSGSSINSNYSNNSNITVNSDNATSSSNANTGSARYPCVNTVEDGNILSSALDNKCDKSTLHSPEQSIFDVSYYYNHQDSVNTNNITKCSSKNDKEATVYTPNNQLFRARSLSIGSTMSSHFINSNNSNISTIASVSSLIDHHSSFADSDPVQSTKITSNDNENVITANCKNQHQVFVVKADKSNKKAHQFFGEQIKLEISAKEIRKEGLKALLYSTVPMGYFLYHLLNEYSSENLFFYLAVENYQNYEFSSDLERQQVAYKISNSYLTRNSELEVNLDDQISQKVKKALIEQQKRPSKSTGNEFDLAKRHVFSLLNVSYYQFRTTTTWNIMESKCGDLNSHNRERSQALVVNLLLSYMKRNQSTALLKLVHSFCRLYLPYGYESQMSLSYDASINTKSSNKSGKNRNRSKSLYGSEKKNSNFITHKLDALFKSNKIK